jgi:hypothetical protein
MSTPNFTRITFDNIYAFGGDAESEVDFELEKDFVLDGLEAGLKDFSPTGQFVRGFEYYQLGFIDRQLSDRYSVRYNLVAIPGYYAGSNIDVIPEITDEYEGGEVDPSDLSDSLYNKYNGTINRIERVVAKNTTPLRCAAVFSNGEAIYERV